MSVLAAGLLLVPGNVAAAPVARAGGPSAPQTADAAEPGADLIAVDDAGVLPAPPEPVAAEHQVLPLLANGQADEEQLATVPAPTEVDIQVHDLGAGQDGRWQSPLPASATSFSTPQAGDARTLVLYDTSGEYAHLGEYYAMAMGTLASHSGIVAAMPVQDYTAGLADLFTGVIYTGSTYDEPIPQDFVDDVLSGDVPVLWSGFNIWQLAATEADRATFSSRYGWDAATSYIDSVDMVTAVEYNGQTLTRSSLNTSGIIAPHVIDSAKVEVLGQAECSDTSGLVKTCEQIAQTEGTRFPWALRSDNLTFIGEIPLSYLTETDRYLAAADLVLDMLQPQAAPVRQAAVRLEDVTPKVDAETVRPAIDYLISEGVPFQIAVVPEYVDPWGVDNEGVPQRLTFEDNPELLALLHHAVDNGGTLVQHGTTHQYGALDNPYNGVSADDFEFIRSWCTQVNDTSAPRVPCEQDSWVQIGGDVGTGTAAWARYRVERGRWELTRAGLPATDIFETPHYAATRASYDGINDIYGVRYERELLHKGLLTGQGGGDFDYYGQFFPYAVNDPYGTHVLPENLGNYEPTAQNQHPPRLAPQVVAAAHANLVVTHATASFFFHPYYDVQALKDIVQGIKAEGYTFVPAASLQ